MKSAIVGALLGATLAIPAVAQDAGDPAKGESEFRKCRV